jgi:hypothetical protein
MRLLAALLLVACSAPQIEPEHLVTRREPTASKQELESTVVILSKDDGHPCCSGVSVLDPIGLIVVLTAAHCVEHKADPNDQDPEARRVAELRDSIWFFAHGAGQAQVATLIEYDALHDRAVLAPDENPPSPLAARKLCASCALTGMPVHSYSALYQETHAGRVLGQIWAGLGSEYWESDLSIEPGWSGSPVFDSSGAVVGLVSKCSGQSVPAGDHMARTCRPRWSLFTDSL